MCPARGAVKEKTNFTLRRCHEKVRGVSYNKEKRGMRPVLKGIRRRFSNVNIPLALLSLAIAIGLHLYVKSLNEGADKTNADVDVYLREQGGSHGKEAHCYGTKKPD